MLILFAHILRAGTVILRNTGMKRNNVFIYRSGLFLAILILAVTSCKKEEGPDYKYLVSNEFVISFKTGYINNMLDIAENSYPEIAGLKPYVTNDIRIYKLIYKTEADGESINASGLVCVPSNAGEYPVICFQNGTNTVNAYAPSEYPLNPLYQMIEAVSSLGYILVIPDYPGFGASSQIPHPYLIAEPTVRSITDMLYAVNEFSNFGLQDVKVKNEYYLMGYSQGGWASLSLHKAIELDFPDDFNLKGSVCGAGPYDLTLLFTAMAGVTTYPMPVYIGYIVNAYSLYHQFTNPVTDILKEPFASELSSLYNGNLSSDEINIRLTTTIADLFTPEFLTGFQTGAQYSSVRDALESNSVTAWDTEVPLYLLHGGADKDVDPVTTENIYDAMISAGTSAQVCTKEILPGLDHGAGVVPCMVKGMMFIRDLQGLP